MDVGGRFGAFALVRTAAGVGRGAQDGPTAGVAVTVTNTGVPACERTSLVTTHSSTITTTIGPSTTTASTPRRTSRRARAFTWRPARGGRR